MEILDNKDKQLLEKMRLTPKQLEKILNIQDKYRRGEYEKPENER